MKWQMALTITLSLRAIPCTLEDLKRFREYEAATARIYRAPVVTYVICSSGAKNIRDHITEGINTYRVKLIQLKDWDADPDFKNKQQSSSLPGMKWFHCCLHL